MKISKDFEDDLIGEGFKKHKVTGGFRYTKLVCADMYLVVDRSNGKYRGDCDYYVGFNIPSIEEVIAEYNVDAALTVGVKLNYEPLLFTTFRSSFDTFKGGGDSKNVLNTCFANFLSHVGEDFSLLREKYLNDLLLLRFPDWVEQRWFGCTHECNRYFLYQIQKTGSLSEEFDELCGQDISIAHWYVERYLSNELD